MLECLAAGEEPPDVADAVAADPTLPSWELDVAELERQLAELHGLAEGMGVELKGTELEKAQRLQGELEEQRQLAAVIEGFKARRGCVCVHTCTLWCPGHWGCPRLLLVLQLHCASLRTASACPPLLPCVFSHDSPAQPRALPADRLWHRGGRAQEGGRGQAQGSRAPGGGCSGGAGSPGCRGGCWVLLCGLCAGACALICLLGIVRGAAPGLGISCQPSTHLPRCCCCCCLVLQGKAAAGSLAALKVDELKLWLKAHDLRVSGNKADLIARINLKLGTL